MHVRVNGVRIFFDVDGLGLVADGPRMRPRPTLLLLHGGPGLDHAGFKPWVAPLAADAQVVYLDHRGNGRSESGDPAHWTLAQWADDVRGFCEALGIERPIVLGESFGGYVAMAYAARHPDHPAGLVLANTSARRVPEHCLAVYARLGAPPEALAACRAWEDQPSPETLKDFARWCAPYYYPRRAAELDEVFRVARNPEVMWRWGTGDRKRFDLRPELPRIACPVLMLGGEDDPVTPIEGLEEIAAHLQPGLGRLVRFPGCGHGVLREAGDAALDAVRAFLRETRARG